jgi:ATP-dependent DNA helicase
MQTSINTTRSTQIVQSLHAVLKPFLLRRLKVDVETELPPKKEYVLYAPLTERQREMYDAIVRGSLRQLLIRGKRPDGAEVKKLSQAQLDAPRQMRKTTRKSYAVDGDDDEYFERLDNPDSPEEVVPSAHQDAQDIGREWTYKTSRRFCALFTWVFVDPSHIVKKVNNMSLQNTVMQLRKGVLFSLVLFCFLTVFQFALTLSCSTGQWTRTQINPSLTRSLWIQVGR